jgi:hypothetical protein
MFSFEDFVSAIIPSRNSGNRCKYLSRSEAIAFAACLRGSKTLGRGQCECGQDRYRMRRADQIALATDPAELDEAVKSMWGHHFAGALTEAEVEALDQEPTTIDLAGRNLRQFQRRREIRVPTRPQSAD